MNNFERKLLKPLDILFNRKIKNYCLGPNAIEIVGCRGVGKSTIYALVAEQAKKDGKKVYCQYPYEGCFQIPVIKVDQGHWVTKDRYKLPTGKFYYPSQSDDDNTDDKPDKIPLFKFHEEKEWIPHYVYQVDKEWLYTTDFSDSVILLDEARTIYPARQFANWTISDDEFFNFLRHLNVTVYLSSQEYAALDVNVHRAVDEVWFLWKRTKKSQFTHVECYSSMTVPCKNLQKSVQLSWLKGEMNPLDWDICYSMDQKFLFYRPPYYDLFDTNFYYGDLKESEVPSWDESGVPFISNS